MTDSEQKKVLLVATVQSHIGQFHKPLMKLLKENGWEVHVAARDNLSEKDTLQLDYPDQVFDIPFQRSPFGRRNIKAYRQLKGILAKEKYDVIHCNTPVGGILARLAARKYRKAGTKVYYTAHGFHFYKGAPKSSWLIYYPLEKWMSRFTDKLITINEEDYELAKRKFRCPVYRIHGVGADSTRFFPLPVDEQQELKKKLNLKGHILLCIGELLPNKNQKAAILALKEVLNTVPDAHLLIAGNGPERKNLEELVERDALTDHVTFLGYTRKLPQYLQVCDLEIACSYREGLPLNVLEAMLCGKPVVASDNRGHREVIQEGVNGYLVNADDTKYYADAICLIFSGIEIDADAIRKSIEPYMDYSVTLELKRIYLDGEKNR